jgi:hypothetical protein
MDQSGIFIAIGVTNDAGDKCLQRGLHGVTIERDDNLTIDGSAATLHVISGAQGAELLLNVLHGAHCYVFEYFAWNLQVRDANESTAQLMLGTFRFGPGPQPTT